MNLLTLQSLECGQFTACAMSGSSGVQICYGTDVALSMSFAEAEQLRDALDKVLDQVKVTA